MTKNTLLAQRLGDILAQLNQGKRVDIHHLADDFGVTLRSIQRDMRERLAFLEWEENGPRFYKINRQKYGILNQTDIDRFALFASLSGLFPKIDRDFYQEKLTESVRVKGFQYEDIRHLEKEFSVIKKAIDEQKLIDFCYTKCGENKGSFYKIAPYSLINKNGIWYLIGTDQRENNKQKTFCFTQISMPKILNEPFEINHQLLDEIKKNDSISFGNQLGEVVIKVSHSVAPYFLRRNLLPNQKLVHKLENGELILASENVHPLDIVPLVQYWIPHLTIISPSELQGQMVEKLRNYVLTENN